MLRGIVATQRAQSRGPEVRRGVGGQRAGQLIGQPELGSVSMCLLQVVRHHLLVLELSLARDPLQPCGEPRVQVGAVLLGKRPVGGVANQDVAEPKRLVTGATRAVGADQLLPHQGHEARSELLSALGRRELGDRGALEDLADHRCSPDEVTLRRLEPVQPRRDEGRDGGRDAHLAEVGV